MCLTGCSKPSGSGADAGSPTAGTSTPCPSCKVTINPRPLVTCVCVGVNQTEGVTATVSSLGGNFSWTSSNPSVATVSGGGSSGTVRGVTAGTVSIMVTYNISGCTCTDTVPLTVVRIDLELKNTGTIVSAPENEDYATDKAAAGGVDTLGPLPMGQGRGDFPGKAYSSPLMVIGTVSPAVASSLTFRWKRFISRRSWNIRKDVGGTKWVVTQRTRRGFPDDDTGADAFNDPTPSANRKIYIYDNSALLPQNNPLDKVGDFIYEEKAFIYRVERNLRGTWLTCAEMNVGQIIIVKRKAVTGTLTSDWEGIENSTAVHTLSALVTDAKVRGIVGGSLPIQVDAHAND